MKTRNRNQEVCPKHQKQLHEKKRQNFLWKQRNISNKYEVKKRIAFKNYATESISAYNAGIEKKVGSGLLDIEKADTMKEEFSHKMGIFIRMWSEDGEKELKEKIEELLSTKEETETDNEVEVLEKTTPEIRGNVHADEVIVKSKDKKNYFYGELKIGKQNSKLLGYSLNVEHYILSPSNYCISFFYSLPRVSADMFIAISAISPL